MKDVRELRHGEKNAWLEVVLDEGRNRQIRRLLTAFDIQVLRLIRVAIGPLLVLRAWRAAARRIASGARACSSASHVPSFT